MAKTTTQNLDLLREQAEFLEYPPEVYLKSSEEEREVVKKMYRREYYLRACKRTNDPDAAERETSEHMSEFPVSKQQLVKTNSKQIRKRRSQPVEVIEDPEGSEDFQVQKDEDGNSVRVYHNQAEVPNPVKPTERDGPTTGPIRERVPAPFEDLVGDRPPRTLLDLYARWPIAEDSDFFLRIERTLPKRYNGVIVTGLVGEIRGRRVSEADIQRMYGGQEYRVILYGPDPRRTTDTDGNPVIKALTDAIVITVPVLPPNLQALPFVNQEPTPMNAMNPFGPTTSPVPTTAGDASMHKANASFFSDAMKMQANEAQRREAEASKATNHLISYMSESNKSQIEQIREEQRRREEDHQRKVEELRAQVDREKAAQEDIAVRVAREKDKSNEALQELYKVMGPDKQAEIQRLSEYYREQLEIIRRSHADQLQSIQSRQDSDLRRADDRLKDTEANYRQILEQERSQSRQMLEQERSQWSQREGDLRAQMEKQTEAERRMAQQRIDDMKERHDAELRQMERAHERELRTLREASDTKFNVAEQTHAMALEHAQERLQDAKEDADRAREEAAEAKDLGKQLESMERQAELLGYEKKDANEPKTPWERLAATAGAGISQVLSTANEWLPAAMAARQQNAAAAMAARELPPQQQRVRRAPPPPRPPVDQGRRRTSGAEWAAEGVHVRPTHQSEPGFQQSAPEPKQASQVAVAPEPPTGNAVTRQAVEPNPPTETPTNGAGMVQVQFPEKFLKEFPAEALLGFLQQAENAVNGGTDPTAFADLMMGAYPDGAVVLVEKFEPKDIWEAVEGLPGTESSSLLRRDGKRWMERLFKSLKKVKESRASQAAAAPQ